MSLVQLELQVLQERVGLRFVFHYGYKYNGRGICYLQRTRNDENRKARQFSGVNQHLTETLSPIVQNALTSRFMTRHWVIRTFQLSYCKDRQHPAEASAKFEHTVITSELAQGLNFWSASRYLYDVIPSTSHMKLEG